MPLQKEKKSKSGKWHDDYKPSRGPGNKWAVPATAVAAGIAVVMTGPKAGLGRYR